MIPAQLRRERILNLVRDREFVRVADLSAMFGLSEVTIRSDLDYLADQGSVQRVHGGAVVRDPTPHKERPFEESLGASAEEKAAIGRYAASLISPGETVILDVGTTTAAVARALVTRPALVLADAPTGALDTTNSARIVELLQQLVADRRQTVILITHDPSVAAAAGRVVSMRDGRIERVEAS